MATLVAVTGLTVPVALAAQPSEAARQAASAAETTELPVYAVRSTGLSELQVRRLARAFGTARLARQEDGSVRFAGETTVPTRQARRGRDEDGNVTTTSVLDLAALRRTKTVSTATALRWTARALASAGLTPRDAKPLARHSSIEVVNRRGTTTAKVRIDTSVSYAFRLAGLPYTGPGAKVRTAYNGRGALTGLTVSTRGLAPAGTVRVLGAEQAQQRCATALGEHVRVRTFDPVYYAPALSTGLERLEPSLRCSGVMADGSATQIVPVPAAADATLTPMDPPPPPREEAPPQATARAYGRADVGSEGTGPCSGLPHTGTNLASFTNRFQAGGVPSEFSWLDQNAWERDFKEPSDQSWTDHVDLTYWQGHGAPTGFSFSGCSTKDDTFLRNTEARWGNGDAEWMSLFTCSVLQYDDGGRRWWQRWGPAFAGLHQINSFHTISWHSASHGGTYANYLLRGSPMRVRSAWAQAAIDDQPADVVWASMGPIGPGGAVSFNDYFWGRGPVSPDVRGNAITGYWYLSGGA